jgi:hypothetical protein
MLIYIGMMQIMDALILHLGYITFTSLWTGAICLVSIGLYKQWRENSTKT